MAGSIILTGANGSLAIPAVQHLLTHYPDFTPILTVRNASVADVNTQHLRKIVAQFPNVKTSIVEVDLASRSAVQDFASSIAADVAAGKLAPIAAIICNAYYWNLIQGVQFTSDGYEKTFQVSHLAHVSLILRLLGSFVTGGGRIVLLSSDAHEAGKNGLEKYPPSLPEDLDLLVKPVSHEAADNFGRGFQKYANSKLAIVTWMYALNSKLEKASNLVASFYSTILKVNEFKDSNLRHITAVAINPGNLSDSRALQINTPTMLYYLSKFVIRYLRPLLRLMDPTMRTVAEAGVDVIDLATEKAYPGERGYFTLLKKDESAAESRDQEKQRKLWVKSAQWAQIKPEDTALRAAIE